MVEPSKKFCKECETRTTIHIPTASQVGSPFECPKTPHQDTKEKCALTFFFFCINFQFLFLEWVYFYIRIFGNYIR